VRRPSSLPEAEAANERTALLARQQGQAYSSPGLGEANQASLPAGSPSRARALALVGIGLSPLANCVLLGEASEDVLVAMVTMHWGAMLVLPMLYHAVRCSQGFGPATLEFYRQLCGDHWRDGFQKSLRGTVLGVPIFLGLVAGYLCFRCKTASWLLCIKNFRDPLEEWGFADHSMLFRLVAALYFTFWNPVIEEFFWRVFLHRELGAASGYDLQEKSPDLADDKGVGPWGGLLRDLSACMPGPAAPVRWGVCAMYASYHTWPIKVVFQRIWWVYAVLGFCFLVFLGRLFLVLRENPHFGLPAAYIVHVWVDAGFAVLCLFEIHPGSLFSSWI